MDSRAPVSLQALTSFRATIRYELHATVVNVLPPGGLQPAARLTKSGPKIRRDAYVLQTGPGLAEVSAHVTPSGAQTPDGTPIGIVNLSGGKLADEAVSPMSGARHQYVVHNPARWRVVQVGLPALVGEALGTTRLHYNRVTDLQERPYLDAIPSIPNVLLPMRFRFSAPGSAGFSVRYRVGQTHVHVAVDEPRLDRRLVLAVVTALIAANMWSPRAELVGRIAPFRSKKRDWAPPHVDGAG